MKTRGIAAVAAMIVMLLEAGCDGKPPSPKQQVIKTETVDVNSVTLNPTMAERVKIGHPELIDISDKLQVPSQIGVNEHGLLLHSAPM